MRDRHAADTDRPHHRDGREDPGAADLHLDRLDDRRRLAGRELVGDTTARGLADNARFVEKKVVVRENDDTVYLERNRFAFFLYFLVEGKNFRKRRRPAPKIVRFYAPTGEGLILGAVRREYSEIFRVGGRAGRRDAVSVKIEFPTGGHLRVELADGTGGDVPRIGIGFVAASQCFGVDALKLLHCKNRFAADDKLVGKVAALKAERDGIDGFDVLGDIFAHFTVAARRSANQEPFAISEFDGQTVHLEIRVESAGERPAEIIFESFEPGPDIAFGKSIVQGIHPHDPTPNLVTNLRESRKRLAGHALGRRIRRDKFRKLPLEVGELVLQRVERRIGNERLVPHVVGITIPIYLLSELCDPFFGLGFCHGRDDVTTAL